MVDVLVVVVELIRVLFVVIVVLLPSVLFDEGAPAGSMRMMYVLVAWSFWPGE